MLHITISYIVTCCNTGLVNLVIIMYLFFIDMHRVLTLGSRRSFIYSSSENIQMTLIKIVLNIHSFLKLVVHTSHSSKLSKIGLKVFTTFYILETETSVPKFRETMSPFYRQSAELLLCRWPVNFRTAMVYPHLLVSKDKDKMKSGVWETTWYTKSQWKFSVGLYILS